MGCLLGLDISTSYVGVAVLDMKTAPGTAGSIVALDHIQLTKRRTLWDKGDDVLAYLKGLAAANNIESLYIEDAAKKFASGRSSATVIATLMRFNGIASWAAWQALGLAPEYVAPSAARKLCGLKMQQSKKCGKSHKQQTFDAMMATDLSHVTWPTKQRSPNLVDWAYDTVDAYVIAKAGLLLEQAKRAA